MLHRANWLHTITGVVRRQCWTCCCDTCYAVEQLDTLIFYSAGQAYACTRRRDGNAVTWQLECTPAELQLIWHLLRWKERNATSCLHTLC